LVKSINGVLFPLFCFFVLFDMLSQRPSVPFINPTGINQFFVQRRIIAEQFRQPLFGLCLNPSIANLCGEYLVGMSFKSFCRLFCLDS